MMSLFLVIWYTQGIYFLCLMIVCKVIVTERDMLERFYRFDGLLAKEARIILQKYRPSRTW